MRRNNKKRIFAAASVLAIILAAGGSIAYFTSADTAHNVISAGTVEIEMHEYGPDGEPFEDIEGAMPGVSYDKTVEIENVGGGEAWIRARTVNAIILVSEEEGDAGRLVSLDFNDSAWTEGTDGWWYYNTALAAGETTDALFTQVTLGSDMSNEYQNCTVTVDVSAQAVQTANNGSTALEAAGWPAE